MPTPRRDDTIHTEYVYLQLPLRDERSLSFSCRQREVAVIVRPCRSTCSVPPAYRRQRRQIPCCALLGRVLTASHDALILEKPLHRPPRPSRGYPREPINLSLARRTWWEKTTLLGLVAATM